MLGRDQSAAAHLLVKLTLGLVQQLAIAIPDPCHTDPPLCPSSLAASDAILGGVEALERG